MAEEMQPKTPRQAVREYLQAALAENNAIFMETYSAVLQAMVLDDFMMFVEREYVEEKRRQDGAEQ